MIYLTVKFHTSN